MLIEHDGVRPTLHPSAYVAPTAVISGDVEIGPECSVLFGAVITSDGGPVRIGRRVTVMENAVVRGRNRFAAQIGDDCLIGPHAHVNGSRIGNWVFVATGASLFPGSVVGERSVIRINGVVHVNTHLIPDAVVPIGWVAVGNPARILPPDQQEAISLDLGQSRFPQTMYGVDPEFDQDREGSLMPAIAERNGLLYGRHRSDKVVG